MTTTLLLNANISSDLERAAGLIRSGELVAVPTETVYGLAADARNPTAVKKIFIAKERPVNHPLIVHISGQDKLEQWASDIPDYARKLAAHFWPGPLTLLLPKSHQVSGIVTGGLETIGLRTPNHPALRQLLEMLDTGLAAPSANPHKKLSPTCAEHVMSGLNGRIAAVLDGGPCVVGVESTIVDCTDATPRILRAGPITAEEISKVLGIAVTQPIRHDTAVAGNMAVHYQPQTKARLLSLTEMIAQDPETCAVLHYTADAGLEKFMHRIQLPAEVSGYATGLYAALHKLDKMQCREILIEIIPQDTDWLAIRDRLKKATAG